MSVDLKAALAALEAATNKAAKPGTKTLAEAKEPVQVAEVVRHGEQITIPTGMTIAQAREVLARREKYEEEEFMMRESINVFPWDGAVALMRVLERKYGWANAQASQGFFGMKLKPQVIAVAVGPRETVNVPWGDFNVPGINGKLTTAATMENDMVVFEMRAEIKRKSEAEFKALANEVREYLRHNSLYRGKSVKVHFRNEIGQKRDLPLIEFMDVAGYTPDTAIYSRHIEAQLNRDLFTPISRVQDLLDNGIGVKRGVLLTGTYGTGKTLAATIAANLANQAGMPYIYVPSPHDLADAIAFGRQYQSPGVVIFVEDIDRVTAGERSVRMDNILNIIDGVDGKSSNVIVVLTTNDLDSINPAMIRPGRLDSIIEITPPDAEAAARLVRRAAGTKLAPDADLTAVGARLQGQIPAVIVEVVRRAKLSQLALQKPGTQVSELSAEGLFGAADSIASQVEILRKATTKKSITLGERISQDLFRMLALGDGPTQRVDGYEDEQSLGDE